MTCSHSALRADPVAWCALPIDGHQVTPADQHGPAERLELRTCPCGSTISVAIPFSHDARTTCFECAAEFSYDPHGRDLGKLECPACGEIATTRCRDCCCWYAWDALVDGLRCEDCAATHARVARRERAEIQREADADALGDAMREAM